MPMHDSPRDQILHAMAQQEWANESDGNVEAPTGFFYRISNSSADISEIVAAFLDEISDIDPSGTFNPMELKGHFLLVENDQGQIFVTEFDSEKALRNAYMDLVVAYCNWADMPAWREDGDDED